MYVYIYPIIPKAHGCIQKNKLQMEMRKKKFIVMSKTLQFTGTNITQKPKELHEGKEKRQKISWRLFSLHHLHIEAKILLSDFEEYVMR